MLGSIDSSVADDLSQLAYAVLSMIEHSRDGISLHMYGWMLPD